MIFKEIIFDSFISERTHITFYFKTVKFCQLFLSNSNHFI